MRSSIGRMGISLVFLLTVVSPIIPYTPSQAQGVLSRYETVDCPLFEIPASAEVECGTLTVPEDHYNPGGPDIRLAVAILKSHSHTPASDPIVYLAGGPGISPLKQYSSLSHQFQPFLERRDVILLDQRGIGFSEPALNCWEITNVDFDNLGENLTDDARAALELEAAERCRIRQELRGVNLAAYNTIQSAADVDALRVALGYEQWNLDGISYGARLALVTLRDYPAGIRSVILDSPYPPQATFYNELAPNAVRTFNALFDRCAADAACSTAYPDLKNVFFSLLAQLDSAPITVSTTYPDTSQLYDVLLDVDKLVRMMEGDLYYPIYTRYLPFLIYEAHHGTVDRWAEQIIDGMAHNRSVYSNGARLASDCHDDIPFTRYDDALASARENVEVGYPILNSNVPIFEICAQWGIAAAEASERSPVYSPIPTLVLTWQYDPVMAPDWSPLVAATLDHSFLVEFPGIGHGVIRSAGECGQNMAAAFFDDPTAAPDTGCTGALAEPGFFVPQDTVSLAPFTDEKLEIEGLIPDQWIDAGEGVYYLDSPLGKIGLVLNVEPGGDVSPDVMTREIERTFDIEISPENVTFHPTDHFLWMVYRGQGDGTALTLGVAQSRGEDYLVLVINRLGAYDFYYENVFIPILDALQPLQP